MPPQWIPRPFTVQSYIDVFTKTGIPQYFTNTLIVFSAILAGTVLTASMAAYAFSRVEWRGRTSIRRAAERHDAARRGHADPRVYRMEQAGILDTYVPLILPAFFGGGAYNIFLLRQFIKNDPEGTGRGGAWWTARPACAYSEQSTYPWRSPP
jgi:multiple sugar transport system permease protein